MVEESSGRLPDAAQGQDEQGEQNSFPDNWSPEEDESSEPLKSRRGSLYIFLIAAALAGGLIGATVYLYQQNQTPPASLVDQMPAYSDRPRTGRSEETQRPALQEDTAEGTAIEPATGSFGPGSGPSDSVPAQESDRPRGLDFSPQADQGTPQSEVRSGNLPGAADCLEENCLPALEQEAESASDAEPSDSLTEFEAPAEENITVYPGNIDNLSIESAENFPIKEITETPEPLEVVAESPSENGTAVSLPAESLEVVDSTDLPQIPEADRIPAEAEPLSARNSLTAEAAQVSPDSVEPAPEPVRTASEQEAPQAAQASESAQIPAAPPVPSTPQAASGPPEAAAPEVLRVPAVTELPQTPLSAEALQAPTAPAAPTAPPAATLDVNEPHEPEKPTQAAPVPLGTVEPELSPAAETAASDPVEEDTIAPVWVSNLYSTPAQDESDQIWRRVENIPVSGRLYRYETTVGGIKQYRIRLGFFDTRSEAEAAGRKITEEAKLSVTPWLVQPTAAEYRRYYGQSPSAHWAVNISSTPVSADSDRIWESLTGKKAQNFISKLKKSPAAVPGPKVYRTQTSVSGQIQYRIRLGFFDTQAEAEKAGRELAAAAGLSAGQIGLPWAVRPTVDEEKANSQ
ncbi:MAG: SPOR domain-containing protein [Deltaproteobacteria bacterium]|jgi:hypothetical protein|nr:SPOR domain-containing protein [Deltaproteobacteria bacterium]